MIKQTLVVFALCISVNLLAQTPSAQVPVETRIKIDAGELQLGASLLVPPTQNKVPVVLIVAGSGATDRDGNNIKMGLHTDSYKLLADSLARYGIASLRYDKRGVGESKMTVPSGRPRLYDDEVQDAVRCAQYLQKDSRFSILVVAGHSQGALTGLLAIGNADKYISLAGIGKRGSESIREQLRNQPPMVVENANRILDSLVAGHDVHNVPAYLNSLFAPSQQPYTKSWFRYDPATEISKLKIPSLIIQGTNDFQIPVEDAQRLAAHCPAARLIVIKNMNHLFRIITGPLQENQQSYSQPGLPLSAELVREVAGFVTNH